RYVWHQAYWTRSPYEGAAWVAPRYEGGSYYNGYWNTDRGPQGHDHRWDRGRERDYNRGRGWGRGHENHDDDDKHGDKHGR
ncbi:MAG TPA: hypothetical protein VNH18_01970, partial [Bryobacteraceae bacterium]|nr:hypothetical protein [Bryobacteraceae bacterium]